MEKPFWSTAARELRAPGWSRHSGAPGHRRLDLVVATHPHADHVGGLLPVLRDLSVGELWICWHDQQDRWVERLRSVAKRRGTKVSWPHAWRRNGVTIDRLWPEGGFRSCADPSSSANQNSIVLRVEFGKSSLLLTGDIDDKVERKLTSRFPGRLEATLLKAAHHGSRTSSSLAFIKAANPKAVVVSCGPANRFSFPHPQVLDRYRRLGVEVLRIDKIGAIQARLTGQGQLAFKPAWSLLP